MDIDQYGRHILSEDDLCDIFLKSPDHVLGKVLLKKPLNFHSDLEITTSINFEVYKPEKLSISDFDYTMQNQWFMPKEYQDLDIAKYVLDLCNTDEELQRVGHELLLFQEREMFPLLQYCKYLVDTMRKNNVVWGVGRGSSVSSYVLYLIGIHKINSLYYDLSIDEFLK